MGAPIVISSEDLYKKEGIREQQPTWRHVRRVVFPDRYSKSRKKYVKGRYKKIIENTEVGILANPTDYKLHEALKKAKNEFSARVTKNLRIEYKLEGETIIFEKIGTHDEVY